MRERSPKEMKGWTTFPFQVSSEEDGFAAEEALLMGEVHRTHRIRRSSDADPRILKWKKASGPFFLPPFFLSIGREMQALFFDDRRERTLSPPPLLP